MRSSRAPLLIPLALVAIGVILLLNNFLLLPNVDLVRWWPVLLIILGLQLLLRGDIGISWHTQPFGITRGTVQSATLEASSGELDVKVRPLRREGRLIAGQYTARSRPGLMVRGAHARVSMQRGQTWPFSQGDWEIGIARDLPWTLALTTHLGEMDVDMRGLSITQAQIATGIGDVRVVLSDETVSGVRVRSTFGNVNLHVPAEVEAIVRIDTSPLARLSIDEKRFLMLSPNVYATLGYERSDNPVHAEIGSTFGQVRLT